MRFATIRLDHSLVRQLGEPRRRDRRTVILCELDEPTLDAVAADLSQVLTPEHFTLRERVVAAPREALTETGRTPLLLPPRVWGRLTPEERKDPRIVPVRYVFDPAELESMGAELGARSAEEHAPMNGNNP